jgi:hypothetical protein
MDTQILPKDGNIDVLRKSRDQAVGFRQRSPSFEEQPRLTSGQAIEKHIERPGDPEIFLNVLLRRAEPACGAKEYVAAVLRSCFEELRKAGIHHDRLVERSAEMDFVPLVNADACFRAVA